jgi:hypothetical protein
MTIEDWIAAHRHLWSDASLPVRRRFAFAWRVARSLAVNGVPPNLRLTGGLLGPGRTTLDVGGRDVVDAMLDARMAILREALPRDGEARICGNSWIIQA